MAAPRGPQTSATGLVKITGDWTALIRRFSLSLGGRSSNVGCREAANRSVALLSLICDEYSNVET